MMRRFLASLVLISSPAIFAQAPPKSTTTKNWTPPKTPWGDPDLQGMWPGNMGVPMQRPEALGTRATLTDEEFAQKEDASQETSCRRIANRRSASDSRVGIGPPSYWTERGTPTRQTSLIIDPPNGRLPALTAGGAEASQRGSRRQRLSRRVARRGGVLRGPEYLLPLHHARRSGVRHSGGL